MAKFSITGEGSSIGTLTRGRDYTGPKTDQMLWWLMSTYGTGTDKDGNPVARTPAQAYNAWADAIFDSFEATVTRAVVDKATADAKAAAEASVDMHGEVI